MAVCGTPGRLWDAGETRETGLRRLESRAGLAALREVPWRVSGGWETRGAGLQEGALESLAGLAALRVPRGPAWKRVPCCALRPWPRRGHCREAWQRL